MFNLQAVHNKAFRRARYIERGPEYKTARKDQQPHAKTCPCRVCKAYLLCIEQLNPVRHATLLESIAKA